MAPHADKAQRPLDLARSGRIQGKSQEFALLKHEPSHICGKQAVGREDGASSRCRLDPIRRSTYLRLRTSSRFDRARRSLQPIANLYEASVTVRKNAVTNLAVATECLPLSGWKSLVLGEAGNARVKLFKVDPGGLPQETHFAWSESLIMIEGEIQVELNGSMHKVCAGEHIHIPAGQPHAICPGGRGHFLLIDPEPEDLSSELQGRTESDNIT